MQYLRGSVPLLLSYCLLPAHHRPHPGSLENK